MRRAERGNPAITRKTNNKRREKYKTMNGRFRTPFVDLYCVTNKIPYASKSKAKKALSKYRNSNGNHSINLYKCQLCGNWHLTSQENKFAN